MAFSEKDIKLLVDTWSIVVKFQSGEQLSPTEQTTLHLGASLFINLAQSLKELSGYKSIANSLDEEDDEVFAKNIPPVALKEASEAIRNLNARENRIEEIGEYLKNILLKHYDDNRLFKWKDIVESEKNIFKEYAELVEIEDDNEYEAYLELRKNSDIPSEEEVDDAIKLEQEAEEKKKKELDEEEERKRQEETEEAKTEEQPHEEPEEVKEKVEVEKPTEVEITAGKADLNILAANIAGLAEQQALVEQIRQKYHNLAAKDLERLIRIATRTAQLRIIAEYAQKANDESLVQARSINTAINPKTNEDPLTVINLASQALVTSAIASSSVGFEPREVETAISNCTRLIIANDFTTQPLSSVQPDQIIEIVQLSLASSGNQPYAISSPTAALYHTFNQAIQTNQSTLDSQGIVQVPVGHTVINKDFVIILPEVTQLISLPQIEATIVAQAKTIPTTTLELVEDSTKRLPAIVDKIDLNPTTTVVVAEITQALKQEHVDALVKAINATPELAGTFIRSYPTKEAHQAEAVAALSPTTSPVDPKAIPLFSMGLTAPALAIVYQHAATHPDSPIAKLISAPESEPFLKALNHSIGTLSNVENKLGGELNPQIVPLPLPVSHQPIPVSPLPIFGRKPSVVSPAPTLKPGVAVPTPPPTQITQAYQVHPASGAFQKINQSFQTFTNRLSGIVPPQAAKALNIVFHPAQYVQNRIGMFVAQRFTDRIKGWATKQVAGQLAKVVGQEVVKKILEQGVKVLIKEGLKKAIEGLLVSTGVGAIAAPLVEVAFWVGEQVIGKTLEAIGKAINGLAVMFTGENLDGKSVVGTLVAAPLAVVGAIGMALAGATAVAASSAAVIIIGSAFIGFILYISVIAVAPIISSIAHLESAQGSPYSVVAGGVVPEGCPSGWAVGGNYITAGPRTASAHHRGVEAIDIGVGLGTPIIATHNGLAVPHPNSGGPYGSFVDVNGTCNGIAFTTRYGHMISTAFSAEQPVKQGQVIGYVDSTGNSTGNHLHYEIRGGNLGDINQFLPKRVPPGCDSFQECNVSVP